MAKVRKVEAGEAPSRRFQARKPAKYGVFDDEGNPVAYIVSPDDGTNWDIVDMEGNLIRHFDPPYGGKVVGRGSWRRRIPYRHGGFKAAKEWAEDEL